MAHETWSGDGPVMCICPWHSPDKAVKLAVVHDGKVIIKKRSNRVTHVAVVELDRQPKSVLNSEHGTDTQSQ